MSEQTLNIHYLENLMSCNSLEAKTEQFPISVYFNQIIPSQAQHIIDRSHALFARMEKLEQKINDLYGPEQTEKLLNNFRDIISYSNQVLMHGSGETYEEYFLKLESFCGQIENIVKMIRYYYALFEAKI